MPPSAFKRRGRRRGSYTFHRVSHACDIQIRGYIACPHHVLHKTSSNPEHSYHNPREIDIACPRRVLRKTMCGLLHSCHSPQDTSSTRQAEIVKAGVPPGMINLIKAFRDGTPRGTQACVSIEDEKSEYFSVRLRAPSGVHINTGVWDMGRIERRQKPCEKRPSCSHPPRK
jgi:hypothetical protein